MSNSSSAEANQAFAALGLGPGLVAALSSLGYEEPTPIQEASIPVLLQGTDLLGLAATGTGKTAAFTLPMLERMTPGGRHPVGLILVPTRELAIQVAQAVHRYGKSKKVTVLPIYGGQSFGQQLKVLRRGVDVVVATPGRALDHLRRGTLDLGGLDTLVLDEADEMLDMGFAEDLEEIREAVPAERQTLLFSATLSPRIERVAKAWLNDAEEVRISSDETGPADVLVRQTAYLVRRAHRLAALGRVLDLESPDAALVFCRTRNDVDDLVESLNSRGYRAEAMHGGMNQDERDRVMKKLRANSVDLLVATDVAARGLDIAHLTHVINYEVPSAAKSYVHRIGRVGRAGREGVAITLVDPREHSQLRSIERLTKQPIALESLPTVADLRARKLEMTRGAVRESLLEGGGERFRAVLESLTDEFDLYDIALGALKVAHEATTTDDSDHEEIPEAKLHSGGREKGGAGGYGKKGKKGFQKIKKGVSPGMARIFIGAGRLAGIRPGHIVGAITGEAGIRSTEVGSIQITDKFSLVEIRAGVAEGVIQALRGSTIKGKKVRVKLDGGRG